MNFMVCYLHTVFNFNNPYKKFSFLTYIPDICRDPELREMILEFSLIGRSSFSHQIWGLGSPYASQWRNPTSPVGRFWFWGPILIIGGGRVSFTENRRGWVSENRSSRERYISKVTSLFLTLPNKNFSLTQNFTPSYATVF